MADDKKNIPDAGKVDEPPKQGKVEPVKADSPAQDQPALAKAEAPVTEGASKVVTPPAAEKPVEGKTAPDPAAEQPAPAGSRCPPTALSARSAPRRNPAPMRGWRTAFRCSSQWGGHGGGYCSLFSCMRLSARTAFQKDSSSFDRHLAFVSDRLFTGRNRDVLTAEHRAV